MTAERSFGWSWKIFEKPNPKEASLKIYALVTDFFRTNTTSRFKNVRKFVFFQKVYCQQKKNDFKKIVHVIDCCKYQKP